jgi:hypothetical protein
MALSLTFVSALMNLNPVLRFDGYWIFIDLLGIPNVNQYTWRYVKGWLRSRGHADPIHERLPRLGPRLKIIFIAYCVLYALGTSMILAFAVGLGVYVLLNPNRLLSILQTLWMCLAAGQWLYFFEYFYRHSMYLMAVALLFYLMYQMGRAAVSGILSGRLKITQAMRRSPKRTDHQVTSSPREE